MALQGLKVLDVATLFAGPLAATMLGDFGADVIKIEHPARPDPSRGHGAARDGVGLWWKMLGRNKRTITLNLVDPGGAARSSAPWPPTPTWSIENFRPGTLERWGIGSEVLHAANPRLVLARVTGFGQFGPYSHAPGLRHARRGHERLRRHHRRARRPADAAALRPRRRRSPR